MPRMVDSERERERIAAAVWRLVAQRGVDAVSLRVVAVEAGVSMGRVQHYFRLKRDLLAAALRYSDRLVEHRVADRLASEETPEYLVRLDEMLGGDDGVRDALRVRLAFASRSSGDSELRALARHTDEQLERLVRDAMERARAAGTLAPGLVVDREARIVVALVAGLGTRVALGETTPSGARALLDHHLHRIRLA